MPTRTYHHLDSSISQTIANGILINLDNNLEVSLVTDMDNHDPRCYLHSKIPQMNSQRPHKISVVTPLINLDDQTIPEALWPDYIIYTSHYLAHAHYVAHVNIDQTIPIEYYIHTTGKRQQRIENAIDPTKIPSIIDLILSDYESNEQITIHGTGNFNRSYFEDFLKYSGKKNITDYDTSPVVTCVYPEDDSSNIKNTKSKRISLKKEKPYKAHQNTQPNQTNKPQTRRLKPLEENSEENNMELALDVDSYSTQKIFDGLTGMRKHFKHQTLDQPTEEPKTKKSRLSNRPNIKSNTRLTNPGSYPLSIHNSELLMHEFMSNRGFDYQYDETSHSDKLDLYIESVAILSSDENKKNLGVFSNKWIEKDTILGEYLGKILHENDVDETHYCFEAGRGKYIDASRQGNWTALVNSPKSETEANVTAFKKEGRIFYEAKRRIKPGEQLLIDYGDAYPFPENARYIKTTDNNQDSIDIINHHNLLYSQPAMRLSSEQSQALGLPETAFFKIPNLDLLHNTSLSSGINWDSVPLLESDEQGQVFPQHQQENILPLAYACVNNNERNVQQLLEQHNVNPNVQSSIHGRTAAHATVQSSLNTADKKKMLTYLFQHEADFSLQDNDNKSTLHIAIGLQNDSEVLDLITHLMEDMPRQLTTEQKKIHQRKMLSTVTNDNDDPFLYSIKLGKIEITLFLSQYLTQQDIRQYLKDESFQSTIKQLLSPEQQTALCNKFLKKCKSTDVIEQLSIVFDKPNIRIKTGVTEHDDQTSQVNHEDQLQQILSNESDSLETTVQKLNHFFDQSTWKTLPKEEKSQMQEESMEWMLDCASWLLDPYLLKITSPSSKQSAKSDNHIYLTPVLNDDGDVQSNQFHYNCIDLEQKPQTGIITINSKKPDLTTVLEAMHEQMGVDITDRARLNKTQTCLNEAKKYQSKLESIGHSPSNKTLTQQKKLIKSFYKLEQTIKSDSDTDSLASGQTDATKETDNSINKRYNLRYS